MIEAMIVDDHPVLRSGLVQALSDAPDIQVVGEAASGPDLWTRLSERVPDVLLLDIDLPAFEAVREVPRIRQQYPQMEILIVTAYDDEAYVRSMVKKGVAGYLLKEEGLSNYVEAIREIADGGVYYSKRILPIVVGGRSRCESLTDREFEVLKLVAKGMTSEQIAAELVVVKSTVDYHVKNINRKLRVENRTAAATKAAELGLVSIWKKR